MAFRSHRLLPYVISLCVIATHVATLAPVAAQVPRKRILLLFDEDKNLPGLTVLDQTIRSTLRAGLEDNVEFYTESIHAAQFPEEQHDIALRDYLSKKYSTRKLDLIVGVMGPALTFLRKHAEAFAPGVPIVFCGADARDLVDVTLPTNMTGVLVRRVFAPTLDVALRLQPDVQQVFVVGGTSEFDRHLLETARHEFERFERRVSITYLTDLAMSDLVAAVSNIPPRSVILQLTTLRDGAGRTFVPHDVVSMISAAAGAPVYVFVDQFLGLGPVGGYLYSVDLHGKASAEVGLRLLRGERAADIPVRESIGNHYMFDMRQLNRWRLDSRLLPADSVIEFREPSVWDRYTGYILGAVVLLIVQTTLIVALLVHRTRRRRAESELRASFVRIREMGRQLLTAQETERMRIAGELHDDINQQLAILKLDLQLLAEMVQGHAETVAGDAVKYADGIATSIRNLSHQLYPPKLRVIGLVAALEGLVAEFSTHNSGITFTHQNVPPTVPPDLSLCVFRIVQEALQNALAHSRAKTIAVHLSGDTERLALSVIDDGVGFVVDGGHRRGFGLISMGERVEAMGGSLSVWSSPQRGTRLNVSVPMRVAENPEAIAG